MSQTTKGLSYRKTGMGSSQPTPIAPQLQAPPTTAPSNLRALRITFAPPATSAKPSRPLRSRLLHLPLLLPLFVFRRHPERVRNLLEIIHFARPTQPHFGCVGTVQGKCAELSLNDSFTIAEEGGRNPQGVSRAAEMADGSLRIPSVGSRVSSDSYMAEGMISCRNCLQFLAGYVLGEGRLQCGKDDAGGLLDDFQ